ncbi:MAG: TonB-dependent receptor [Crocinitomicaceae bacterium]
MKVLFLFFISVLICFSGFSQRPSGAKGRPSSIEGEIFGSIIDSATNESIGYVTVLALKQSDQSMVGGVVTESNGNFSISGLKPGVYTLKMTFVGYKTKEIKNININAENTTYQFKNIGLTSTILTEVEVVGDVPLVTYEIDKKIINVEDQNTNVSQTALEVLQNAPSVTVDANGNVSLRGSASFTLLIDGIPTAMDANDALAIIPASTIKDIEIITNPSAKFDAEGTSGVINIVTKKSKLEGISLLANVSAGTFDNYSGDIAINLKKEKFTIDLSGNFRQRSRPSDSYNERKSIYDTLTNKLVNDGVSDWKMGSKGFKAELMYTPNNSHVLSVRTRVNGRLMVPYSARNYQEFNNDVLVSEFSTDQNNYIDIFGTSTSLYYQYNIKRNKAHNISFKAIANLRDVTQDDSTTSFNNDGDIVEGNLYTETGPSNSYRFNADYKLPLKKDRKFEAGLQSQFGTSADNGKNFNLNLATMEYELNELFSSEVAYTRNVHAAYTMFSGKTKGIGYQLGLRAEYTDRSITSTNLGSFATINRLDWFPSAHFSYSLKNKSQVLVSYSRRIQRPRSYFFEPFVTWEGPFSVRSGNPNLTPEYINAFEVSFIKPIKEKKGYLSFEVYARTVSDIITRISRVYTPGVLISQPYNVGNSLVLGFEPSINYKITEWWKINAALNAIHLTLTGEIEDVSYDRQSLNYNGRITNTFTVKGFDIQLMSRYESPTVTTQGKSTGYFTQDASIKKSFKKNKYSFILQGRNILNTQKVISEISTGSVEIYDIWQPLYPMVNLTFSLKLNNYQKVYSRSEQMDDF